MTNKRKRKKLKIFQNKKLNLYKRFDRSMPVEDFLRLCRMYKWGR